MMIQSIKGNPETVRKVEDERNKEKINKLLGQLLKLVFIIS